MASEVARKRSATPSRDDRSTEERLKEAAMTVLDRDGILGGVRLNEVAAEAGANRALVYRHFGSGKGLLRQALKWEVERVYPDLRARQSGLGFVKRRDQAFDDLLDHSRAPKLMLMLVLDGDESVQVSPLAATSIARLEEEVERGELRDDIGVLGIHAYSVAAVLGYAVVRERLAEELGVSVDELDRQVRAARHVALEAFVPPSVEGRTAVANGKPNGKLRNSKKKEPLPRRRRDARL